MSVDIYQCHDFPLLFVWINRFCFLPNSRGMWLIVPKCNIYTCSGNCTQEQAVMDLLWLVDLYLVYLI